MIIWIKGLIFHSYWPEYHISTAFNKFWLGKTVKTVKTEEDSCYLVSMRKSMWKLRISKFYMMQLQCRCSSQKWRAVQMQFAEMASSAEAVIILATAADLWIVHITVARWSLPLPFATVLGPCHTSGAALNDNTSPLRHSMVMRPNRAGPLSRPKPQALGISCCFVEWY